MSKKSYNSEAGRIKEAVKGRYGAIAQARQEPADSSAIELLESRPPQNAGNCCGPLDCCTPGAEAGGYAQALYSADDLTALPESVASVSLGCGSPTAIASLRPGETVLDLGSGGGIDCFLAAKAVGSAGYVIGVDMTEQMLALANRNKAKVGLTNVEFRRGEIEDLPVDSQSVDVIISNCVINLAPDKEAVFREAFRVLKAGGRLIVSDIVTEGHLPDLLRANLSAWADCLAGAIDQELYIQKMRQAGFSDIVVESYTSLGQENLADFLDEASRAELEQLVAESPALSSLRVYSANITARKAG